MANNGIGQWDLSIFFSSNTRRTQTHTELNTSSDGHSMYQKAYFYCISWRQNHHLTSYHLHLLLRKKSRHDPSVRDSMSQVINADKTDHLWLINHFLSQCQKFSHSIWGIIMNILGFFPPTPANGETQMLIIICTDDTAHIQHIRPGFSNI